MDALRFNKSTQLIDQLNSPEFQRVRIADQGVGAGQRVDAGSFASTLSQAIQSVNQAQKASDSAMEKLATGQTDNIPEVMIAAEKADIALKLMVQVRNKMIEAYQEVMRMQV